jgi:hypothetical protein
MKHACELCRDARGRTQVVVYSKDRNARCGYLALDGRVYFDSAAIARFLYFCATRGLATRENAVLDVCDECIRSARVGAN